jgi:hypothetical protein
LLPSVNPRDEGILGHPAVTRLDPLVIDELFLRRVLGTPASAAPVPAPAPSAAAIGSAANDATAASGPAIAPAPVAVPEGEWPKEFVHDATSALAALAAKTAWMAVLSRPLPMQQVVHVADLAQELPPRSTHFYPPLLGGLAMLRLTGDEDLV